MSSTRSPSFIPNLPRDSKIVDRDGNLTDSWKIFFDQLILSLQTNFKPEGFVIPSVTNDQLTFLTGTTSNNNILYVPNSGGSFKGNINGTWKTFTLT